MAGDGRINTEVTNVEPENARAINPELNIAALVWRAGKRIALKAMACEYRHS